MRVLVRGAHLGKFQAACAEFGYQAQANQSMNVWFGADDLDSLNEYIMPDHSAVATWIVMSHPEWLHEIWSQGPAIIVDDSQETFLKMNSHDQS